MKQRILRIVLLPVLLGLLLFVFGAVSTPQAHAAPTQVNHTVHAVSHQVQADCWHVYHNGRINFNTPVLGFQDPVWLGTVHIMADVCADGQHVWLQNNATSPTCWTDNGFIGTAQIKWCGITWIGNIMRIGANMYTHAVVNQTANAGVNIGVNAGVSASAQVNIDTHEWIREDIYPDMLVQAVPMGGTYENNMSFDMY